MTEWPNWKGEVVMVVATGPSAADVPLDKARGLVRTIAVKDGWKLAPWADCLYAADHHWWEAHKGVMAYKGRRICYDDRTVERWRGENPLQVKIMRGNKDMIFGQPGVIGWGGNSGFHAFNLAIQFGARAVILVGFDMRVDRGLHFFGAHPYSMAPSEPNVRRWAATLNAQAAAIKALGVEVINCSPVSAISAYPKMTLEDALATLGVHRFRRPGGGGLCGRADVGKAAPHDAGSDPGARALGTA